MAEDRIGDAERDGAVRRLGEAFADGRLDDVEYEARLKSATRATVGSELDVLFTDLPDLSITGDFAATTRQAAALDRFRRSEVAPFVGGAVICTVIWAFTSFGGYFWPMWVWFGVIVFAVQHFFTGGDESS